MTLAAGSRLGPFEITAKLGEGGMSHLAPVSARGRAGFCVRCTASGFKSTFKIRFRNRRVSWHLRFVAPPSYFTIPNVGGDDTVDSDAIPATGETAPFSVTVNVLDSTVDAGFVVSLIFWDGFESGDTNAWSATVP